MLLMLTSVAFAEEEIAWQKQVSGISYYQYPLPSQSSIANSFVHLFLFPLDAFEFDIALANDLNTKRRDVKSMAKSDKADFAINAHFFDPEGDVLGLLIKNNTELHPMHKGGGLLTGIFYIENNLPKFSYRNNYSASNPNIAIQSGPRLIENGKRTAIKTNEAYSRRSGIAITKDNQILIFATELRFPGATLLDIQKILSNPRLNIRDALNFDGGSSSQVYTTLLDSGEFYISGGDIVPTALIARKK